MYIHYWIIQKVYAHLQQYLVEDLTNFEIIENVHNFSYRSNKVISILLKYKFPKWFVIVTSSHSFTEH